MTRTAVAIFSLICSSALAATAPQTGGQARVFKPSPSAVRPSTQLPPPKSIKTLFGGTPAKAGAQSNLTLPRLPLPVKPMGHETEHWLACGMTIFMADPKVDGKSLKKHSSEGFPARRIEPQTCK
jgi:hypothetical protein